MQPVELLEARQLLSGAGQPDQTFANAGVLALDLAETSIAAFAEDRNGSLYVGGTSSTQIVLARYDAQGQLDLRFGTGGIVTLPWP
jgi:hypothetical protein